jgi:hypothetical protein
MGKIVKIIMSAVFVFCFLFTTGCEFSGSSSKRPSLLVGEDPVTGEAPAESAGGIQILAIDSNPKLDVVEQGGTFSLIFTYDSLSGGTVSAVVLTVEGSDEYYLLEPSFAAGDIITVTFQINPDYPYGSYPLLVALVNSDGTVGGYLRLILHIAFVPELEILDLYPAATIGTAEGGDTEALNVVGMVFFSKEVSPDDFTFWFEDSAGNSVDGIVSLMPGKRSALYRSTTLLAPNSQYSVVVDFIDGPIHSNTFWTDDLTPMGANYTNAVGTSYKFLLQADNVVEPAAAAIAFGLLQDYIPPFAMMVTEIDPGNNQFSALGTFGTKGDPMEQDFRPAVSVFADDDQFNDPCFLGAPSDLALSVNTATFGAINMTMYDFTISGCLASDGSGFSDGKIYTYFKGRELADLAGDILGAPPGSMDGCTTLTEIASTPMCDEYGRIIVVGDFIEGTAVPTLTEFLDLVPTSPLNGGTISSSGGTIIVSGQLERNGGPYTGTGWTVKFWATQDGADVGSFVPASPVALLPDGSFSTVLTVGPLGTIEPLVIHMSSDDFGTGFVWSRDIELTVE